MNTSLKTNISTPELHHMRDCVVSSARVLCLPGGALLLLFLAACGQSAKQPGTDAANAAADSSKPKSAAPLMLGPSDVAVVIESSVAGGVQISGPLDPAVSVDIKAQIDGNLRGLRVDRGSAVTKGETLVTIDGAGLQSSAAAAKAAIASAQADLAVADQNYAASQKLLAAGAISQLDFKTAAAQQQGAMARLESAKAQATMADENIKYADVTSPITGSVSAKVVQDGQAVRKGDQMLTLVDTRTLELKGHIGVDDAVGVKAGQHVTFTLDAEPGRSIDGEVARIDPVADPGTRQVGVYARFNNDNHREMAGQYAHGRIDLGGAKAKGLAVPTSAVRTGDDGSHWVLVIANGHAAKRVVEVGSVDEVTGLTLISKGLRQGEQIIASTAAIADGTAVQLPADPSRKGN